MPLVAMLERALRHERLIVGAGLALITALAWLYVLSGAGTGMSPFDMSTWRFPPPAPDAPHAARWSVGYGALMLTMWWVMMVAMMVPSAAPMVLLYQRVSARAQTRGQSSTSLGRSGLFVSGYLIVWLAFSVLATLAQWMLEAVGLLDGMAMWSSSRTLSGVLLLAAGIYQLTPAKRVCLEHCRSPAAYLAAHWRHGPAGALRMGMEHGAYCLGCCWALMMLLFAGGAMNLIWIAGLSVLVLVEKLAPFGRRLQVAIGVVLALAGAWVLTAG